MSLAETLAAVGLPRLAVALAALAVPVAMWEMGNRHWRGNFHRAPMYLPLVVPPLHVAAAFLLLGTGAPWARTAFAVAAGSLVVLGAAGVFFHAQGVARQTGGWTFDNVMVGPPLTAPLAFAAIGVASLAALAFWEV